LLSPLFVNFKNCERHQKAKRVSILSFRIPDLLRLFLKQHYNVKECKVTASFTFFLSKFKVRSIYARNCSMVTKYLSCHNLKMRLTRKFALYILSIVISHES
jgi:hypothetical protein